MALRFRTSENPSAKALTDMSFDKPNNGSGMAKPTDAFMKAIHEPVTLLDPHLVIDVSIVPSDSQRNWILNIPLIAETKPKVGPREVFDIAYFANMLYDASVKKIFRNRNPGVGVKRSYESEPDESLIDVKTVVKNFRYIGTLFRQPIPWGRHGQEIGNFRSPNFNEVRAAVAVAGSIDILNVFSEKDGIEAGTSLWMMIKEVCMAKVEKPRMEDGMFGPAGIISPESCGPEDRCIVMVFVTTTDGEPPKRVDTKMAERCLAEHALEPPKESRSYKEYIRYVDPTDKKTVRYTYKIRDAFVTLIGKSTKSYLGKRTPKDTVTDKVIISNINDIKTAGPPFPMYLHGRRDMTY